MNLKQNAKTKDVAKQSNNAKTAFMELASMAGITKSQPSENQSTATPKKVVSAEKPSVEIFEAAKKPMETSIIAADVIVEGTIHTQGALDCRGVVNGNLSAKGNICVSGKQIGDIKGLQINFANACIDGNVTAEEHIAVDRGTKIKGDLHGCSVTLDGQVTGLIYADKLVRLCKNAVLVGDIQAGSISIEEGAKIEGQIIMNFNELEQVGITSVKSE